MVESLLNVSRRSSGHQVVIDGLAFDNLVLVMCEGTRNTQLVLVCLKDICLLTPLLLNNQLCFGRMTVSTKVARSAMLVLIHKLPLTAHAFWVTILHCIQNIPLRLFSCLTGSITSRSASSSISIADTSSRLLPRHWPLQVPTALRQKSNSGVGQSTKRLSPTDLLLTQALLRVPHRALHILNFELEA